MKLLNRHRSYLTKKQLGGEINERGNRYEGYFTTFKIAEHINLYPHKLNHITISSQDATFVDDLLITNDRQRTLFQLKTSKKLKWGLARKLKTLNFDFSIQRRIELYFNRDFRLCLVVANTDLQSSLLMALPSQLRKCTDILMFPSHESIQKQILNDPLFRAELEKLIAFPSATVDKLESLATTILGIWHATNKKQIRLEELQSKLEEIGYAFIRPRIACNLDPSTKDILDAIPDFRYVINNNYLSWSYKTADSGVIPYQIGSQDFVNIALQIHTEKPVDFLTLEKIIS